MDKDFLIYLSGEKLYGNDFTIEEIRKWFLDEAEAYADLGAKEKNIYRYPYHQLNKLHAFKFISPMLFNEALGIGSAYGYEFEPIINQITSLTILEPSDAFSEVKEIFGNPCRYIKPNPSGDIPFYNNYFDLITSLGVMHHIPNVSHVISECYRCLNNKGIMLLHEPIVSMGDWRKPRKGLTKRERGIPLQILDRIVLSEGFTVKHKALLTFPLIPKIAKLMRVEAYNNYILTIVDAFFSKVFSWNIQYHRTELYKKFAPCSVYYVLEK